VPLVIQMELPSAQSSPDMDTIEKDQQNVGVGGDVAGSVAPATPTAHTSKSNHTPSPGGPDSGTMYPDTGRSGTILDNRVAYPCVLWHASALGVAPGDVIDALDSVGITLESVLVSRKNKMVGRGLLDGVAVHFKLGRGEGAETLLNEYTIVSHLRDHRVRGIVPWVKLLEMPEYARWRPRRFADSYKEWSHVVVTPWISDRQTLSALYAESPLVAVARFREVVSTIDQAHRCGVVHLDLKVDNLVITRDKSYVVDWEVATRTSELPNCSFTPGSSAHAPEIETKPTKESDLWGLGVCLFVMVRKRLERDEAEGEGGEQKREQKRASGDNKSSAQQNTE